MKFPQIVWLLGGLGFVACAHTSSSQQGRAASTPVAPPLSSSTPVPLENARTVIDQPGLTPANGVGSPRPVASASLVSTQQASPAPSVVPPTVPDQASSDDDWQSIQEIRQTLAADPRLVAAASQITITARDGRVFLRGQVTTAEQRALIEKAARQAGGVIEVRNMLQVME